MPHQPDDDGYEPPLKVLRKRFNGVYREDYGFSGPTRRYLLMVVILVGLASVPTLAVVTVGAGELARHSRSGAMDAPLLPAPMTGPVRLPPPPSGGPSRHDRPAPPPSGSGTAPTASPAVTTSGRTRAGGPAAPTPRHSDVDDRPGPVDAGVRQPKTIVVFPTVPGLPVVPADDWTVPLARRAPAPAHDGPARGKPADGEPADDPPMHDEPADDKPVNDKPADNEPADDKPPVRDDSSADRPKSSDRADSSDEDPDVDTTTDHADEGDAGDPDQDDSPHHECEAAYRSTVSDRPAAGPTPAGGQQ